MFVRSLAPLAALAALAFSSPAFAEPISLTSASVGQSYTLNYNGFSDGTTVSGLTAQTTFTLTGVTDTSYTFSYSVTNTTSGTVDSRVSVFGFDTDPTISSATSTGAFSFTTLNSNVPNGIGTVDVCFKDAKTGSCAGGGSGGLIDGQTGTGSLTLNFSSPITGLTLDNFFVRYQSITGAGNITSATGTVTSSSTSGGTSVPEPGMLGMMAGGIAVVALFRRRRRTAKGAQPALALA